MASGLLSLKWNNHKSTFFHVLSSIRSKESYCDVTLACDGRFYPVHKLILSTCSEYFEQMFEKTQCKHPIIVLKDIKFDDLEALLNYMYIGEVNVLQERLAGLIKAAECLKIKGLAVPDEDPRVINKESKRSHKSDTSSPQSKRRRRSVTHNENRPHSSHISESQRINISDKFGYPDRQNTNTRLPNEEHFESDNISLSDAEGSESTITHIGKDSNKDESILGTTQKVVPEVYLDELGVKTEPPDIEEEEVTESKEALHGELDYEQGIEDCHVGEDVEASNSTEEFAEASVLTPRSVDDEGVSQALPSSSNFQGDSFQSWEGDGSLQSFPEESFSVENSQGRSNDPEVEGQMTSSHHELPKGRPKCVKEPDPLKLSLKINSTSISIHDSSQNISSQSNHSSSQLSSLQDIMPSYPMNSPSSISFIHSLKLSSAKGLHICQICSKPFASKTALTMHQRTHTGEKPFSCNYCDYRTTQKGNLATHIRTHTGEEPFHCSHCPARFRSASGLKNHTKSKHLQYFLYPSLSHKNT